MQTLFEPKTKLPVDVDVLERMKKTAETELSGAEMGQYTQVVVILSATGKQYSALIQNALSEEKADETALLERMKALNDTEIRYVLCMWQDQCIDVPSYAFRKLLCALNPKNTEAMLFVMTADGVCGIQLSTTMK